MAYSSAITVIEEVVSRNEVFVRKEYLVDLQNVWCELNRQKVPVKQWPEANDIFVTYSE